MCVSTSITIYAIMSVIAVVAFIILHGPICVTEISRKPFLIGSQMEICDFVANVCSNHTYIPRYTLVKDFLFLNENVLIFTNLNSCEFHHLHFFMNCNRSSKHLQNC